MSDDECKACQEYSQISRRNFVGLSAGLVVGALAPGWLPRVVYAGSDSSSRDVIVSIFLRGGADSLSMVVPYAEDNYYQLRPTLAVPRPDGDDANRVSDLDGFFGFSPSMAPLREAYDDGSLLVVHACGSKDPTRSHFEAMRFMEAGQGSGAPTLETGWLGRHLQATASSSSEGVLRAVGIGAGLQRTLAGGPNTLPIADLDDFGLEGRAGTRKERRAALEELYAAWDDPLRTSADSTMRTVDLLRRIGFRGYKPKGGARYPENDFGYALKSAAALIKAEVGVEAIAIDLSGWDTHEFQGNLDGHMDYLMMTFAESLGAFHKDLFSDDMTDISVVVMSEFGRNVAENGSEGTDHGHGGMMLALGGGIAGGRVLTDWPGLADRDLYQGQDLEITIDYRDVLVEILERRVGNSNWRTVFPDSSYSPRTRGVTV